MIALTQNAQAIGRKTGFFSGEFSLANPRLPYIASHVQRGLPVINTLLQWGVGDGLGVGTA